MSEEIRMLTLRAPHGHITHERLVLHGLRCGYCQGNGWLWGHDEIGESVKEPCPICKGRKMVEAEVRIEWKAEDGAGL